jgi:hypothetical protein
MGQIPRWVYWNVTQLVQRWVDDTYPNYGVALRVGLKTDPADPSQDETDPGPAGILWLRASEAQPPDHIYRPRLIVTYRVSISRPNLESIAMLNTDGDPQADDGWAVGQAGVIFRYDGANWAQWANGGQALPEDGLKAVSMRPDGSEGWAVGDGGAILRYQSLTNRWAAVASPTGQDLAAVSIAANGQGLAVGESGEILKHEVADSADPNSDVWIVDTDAPAYVNDVNLTAIKAFSAARGWGVGEEATIIRKRGGDWMADGEQGTVVEAPGIGDTHLRGIDMLPTQSTVTDWRESY